MAKIPFGSIPKDNILAEGNYTVEIEQGESGLSKNGFKQITIPLRTLAPIAGQVHYERFMIGTEDDKEAEDPQTWVASFAARRLSTLLAKAQVPVTDDMEEEEMLSAAVGYKCDVAVTHKVDDGSKNPQYKGQIRVQLRAFEEGVLQKGGAGRQRPGANGPAGRPRIAPQTQPAVTQVEEYEEPEETPAQQPPKRVPPRPAPRA